MYQDLCHRFPPLVVEIGYVLWRTLLIVVVTVCSDVTLGAFQYVNF